MSLIKAKGTSMVPTIMPNDLLEIKKENYCLGDVVLYKSKGKHIIHRIIKVENSNIHTKGDNDGKTELITKKQIIAKVTKNLTSKQLIHKQSWLRKGIHHSIKIITKILIGKNTAQKFHKKYSQNRLYLLWRRLI